MITEAPRKALVAEPVNGIEPGQRRCESDIPVVLFSYARPSHLRRTLACLQEDQVPLIFAFSDGPRTPDKVGAVAEARDLLRAIDWCEVVLCERVTNFGLGRSIVAGVTEVLSKHEAAIIFEDDLICVPGTYAYLCAALKYYRHDPRVMSVTGWTHPMVTPPDVIDQPYLDGRAECWVWGTWRRAWRGMDQNAMTLVRKCESQGLDVFRYGADLPEMAEVELKKNIWAVRLLYLHILNRGLCLRPPWSMVEHIGFDTEATNAREESWLKNSPLKLSPPIPQQWPEPVEHPACSQLHQKVYGARPPIQSVMRLFVRRVVRKVLRTIRLR